MMRLSGSLMSTKVLPLLGSENQVVLVGIKRDRYFGQDSIEEALKVADSLSAKHSGFFEVLAGINQHEYQLSSASVLKRKHAKGCYMSPLIDLCFQNKIPISHVGRSVTATSSKLSSVSFSNPLEFYKLLWLLAIRSFNALRSPQARSSLRKRIPSYVASYFDEAAECMALKIIEKLRKSHKTTFVVVVPLENYVDVSHQITELHSITDERARERLSQLEDDNVGLWLPVLLLYILLPCGICYEAVKFFGSSQISQMSKYETEGILLGTWVRDKTRD